MRFPTWHKKKSAQLDREVVQVRARMVTMRSSLQGREVELAGLFGLAGEVEPPGARARWEAERPEAPRVWPDEVPSLDPVKDAERAFEAKVTYGDWELMRRPGPFTVR